MAIDKLPEFAKDGQKNTDDLVLTDGFPVLKKPARQWFNWLFNILSLKTNEIIDEVDTKLSKSSNLSDLTDLQAALTNLGFQQNLTGYQKLPSGLIFQWGFASVAQAGTVISFPIAFPVNCLNVQLTDEAAVGSYTITPIAVATRNNANFTAWTTAASATSTFWFAIGY